MKPFRVAIIGTGAIAGAHVAALKRQGERVHLAAAVDVDQTRVDAFCSKHGIPRAWTDAAEMLSTERPDLVHVCAPSGLHAELSVQALAAGAWVLCEKPLCGSLADMDRIEATERKTGRFCSSVFQWRFGSGIRHLRTLIAAGEMGRPLVGICHTTWYRDAGYYRVSWRGKWATELGGCTMTLGIHAIDAFLWLLGDWQDVRATVGTLDRQIEVEDVSMALVRFANGAMGSIVVSSLCPRQETSIRLDFQKCTVELKSLYGYRNEDWKFTVTDGSPDAAALERWRTLPPEVPSSHEAQLADLLDHMERGERPLLSGAEARRTIEFLSALYKSALTGEAVRRGSIIPGDPFYHTMSGKVSKTRSARKK